MALEKAHSSNKKMTFGENRDLKQIVAPPVVSGKVKRVNVNFDEEKHLRFKAACARKGTSLTDVINHLVDDWLEKNE
ncbi:plasmid partition protein ParG [uncultured Pantoea sp.]|uniref:plasmid partition protein ParG n=1 Tax=uncultured Pantoea sp. TaxID=218084 RepID=UPI0028043D6B|nr:plasmid partition protein ParG [uncultured Pantoea sp.]